MPAAPPSADSSGDRSSTPTPRAHPPRHPARDSPQQQPPPPPQQQQQWCRQQPPPQPYGGHFPGPGPPRASGGASRSVWAAAESASRAAAALHAAGPQGRPVADAEDRRIAELEAEVLSEARRRLEWCSPAPRQQHPPPAGGSRSPPPGSPQQRAPPAQPWLPEAVLRAQLAEWSPPPALAPPPSLWLRLGAPPPAARSPKAGAPQCQPAAASGCSGAPAAAADGGRTHTELLRDLEPGGELEHIIRQVWLPNWQSRTAAEAACSP
eukprot:TRINITY_DN8820_c2_g1_i2.p2 TRINITY_DN8820_c2_g1~~TRINITY_DN8820_c2_g1_i2.p2  ORF type:complete len:292 (+),score=94.82 TRINITY_DN8820_c2_g1_i2:81-878(+)